MSDVPNMSNPVDKRPSRTTLIDHVRYGGPIKITNTCSHHPALTITSFCKTHNVCLCFDCLTEEHKQCFNSNEVQSIENTIENTLSTANESIRTCGSLSGRVRDKTDKKNKILSRLTNAQNEMKSGIRQMSRNIILQVNKLAADALEVIDSVLNEHSQCLGKDVDALQQLADKVDKLRESIETCDIDDIEEAIKEIKSLEKALTTCEFDFTDIRSCNNELVVRFHVSPMLSYIHDRFKAFGELCVEDRVDNIRSMYLSKAQVQRISVCPSDADDIRDEESNVNLESVFVYENQPCSTPTINPYCSIDVQSTNQPMKCRPPPPPPSEHGHQNTFLHNDSINATSGIPKLPKKRQNAISGNQASELKTSQTLPRSLNARRRQGQDLSKISSIHSSSVDRSPNTVTHLETETSQTKNKIANTSESNMEHLDFSNFDQIVIPSLPKKRSDHSVVQEKKPCPKPRPRRTHDDLKITNGEPKNTNKLADRRNPDIPKLPLLHIRPPTIENDNLNINVISDKFDQPLLAKEHTKLVKDNNDDELSSVSSLMSDSYPNQLSPDMTGLLQNKNKIIPSKGPAKDDSHTSCISESRHSDTELIIRSQDNIKPVLINSRSCVDLKQQIHDPAREISMTSSDNTSSQLSSTRSSTRSNDNFSKQVKGDVTDIRAKSKVHADRQKCSQSETNLPSILSIYKSHESKELSPHNSELDNGDTFQQTDSITLQRGKCPPFESVTKPKETQIAKHLQEIKPSRLEKRDKDKGNVPLITDFLIFDTSHIVACDYLNDRLQLFNNEGALLYEYKISKPFGCCLIRQNRFVLSCTTKQSVCIFDSSESKLKCIKDEKIGCDVFGISFSCGFICVCCLDHVRLLTENLETYKTVRVFSDFRKPRKVPWLSAKLKEKPYFSCVQYSALDWSKESFFVYVTDLKKDRVICVNTEGLIIWNHSVNEPRGICLYQDRLFVAAKKKVYVLCPNSGRYLSEIKKNLTETPCALVMSNGRLFMSGMSCNIETAMRLRYIPWEEVGFSI